MDLTQISVLSGLAATLILAVVTIARQREFEPKQFYYYLAAFLSGGNVPPSVYLAIYVFFPESDSLTTKLQVHEIHICFAGLALFIASLMGLWKLLQDAYMLAPKEPSGRPSS